MLYNLGAMQVAYVFCETDQLRVPLFDYDPRLFRFFISRGGKWDKERKEFILKNDISMEQFNKEMPEVPIVKVDEKSPVIIKVHGFTQQTWRKGETKTTVIAEGIGREPPGSSKPEMRNLPDKFPQHWLMKLNTELAHTKSANQTKENYLYYIRLLCQITQKFPEEIQHDDVKKFLAYMDSKKYAAATMNAAVSAIKYFYRYVLPKNFINEQRRPRQDKRLPVVLSKTEIKKILAAEKNFKHRILIILVYSSGLRVSEVAKLRKEEIDITRNVLTVKMGKGCKDRVTIVSKAAIKDLQDYYIKYKITDWVFPSSYSGGHLTIRTAQHIFKHALKAAGIKKPASIHCLRHSFATHLYEAGIEIHIIQKLLGHASVRTTERYTHVAKKNALLVSSPFDNMNEVNENDDDDEDKYFPS